MHRDTLTSKQRQELERALLAAFPQVVMLDRMLRYSRFNTNLSEISTENNLTAVVYRLIEWCERRGRVNDLIESAYADNPGNPYLKQFVESWHSVDMNKQLLSLDITESFGVANKESYEQSNPIERNQVFISYTHADAKWLKQLQLHLKPLIRADKIKVWDDTMIAPGSNWREEIEKAIKAAKVAILLISANYLASDFVANEELPPLLAAAEQDGALILPVIIGHCRFTQTKNLSRFQAINPPSQPLASLSGHKRDAVFVKVSDAVDAALKRKDESQRKEAQLDDTNLLLVNNPVEEMVSKNITNEELVVLHAVLKDIFTWSAEIQNFVSTYFDMDLDAISPNHESKVVGAVIVDLIIWSITSQHLAQLIVSVRTYDPDNQRLEGIAQEILSYQA